MRKSRSASAAKLQFKPTYLVLGAAGVAVLAVAVLIAINQFSAKSPSKTDTALSGTKTTAYDECPNLISGYSKTMGSPNAPVEIIEFSDYQCPICRRFTTEYQPQLAHDFVCTGKVRFTYKDFAFLDTDKKLPESHLAAQAANCAADQGKFWAYHDKLFGNQHGENRGAFHPDKLKDFARDLQLDLSTFSQCLDTGKYASQVNDETQEGQRRGVDATPILFINDQVIRGLPASYDDLRQAIEKASNKQQ